VPSALASRTQPAGQLHNGEQCRRHRAALTITKLPRLLACGRSTRRLLGLGREPVMHGLVLQQNVQRLRCRAAVSTERRWSGNACLAFVHAVRNRCLCSRSHKDVALRDAGERYMERDSRAINGLATFRLRSTVSGRRAPMASGRPRTFGLLALDHRQRSVVEDLCKRLTLSAAVRRGVRGGAVYGPGCCRRGPAGTPGAPRAPCAAPTRPAGTPTQRVVMSRVGPAAAASAHPRDDGALGFAEQRHERRQQLGGDGLHLRARP
jgi:hypothetical protein